MFARLVAKTSELTYLFYLLYFLTECLFLFTLARTKMSSPKEEKFGGSVLTFQLQNLMIFLVCMYAKQLGSGKQHELIVTTMYYGVKRSTVSKKRSCDFRVFSITRT